MSIIVVFIESAYPGYKLTMSIRMNATEISRHPAHGISTISKNRTNHEWFRRSQVIWINVHLMIECIEVSLLLDWLRPYVFLSEYTSCGLIYLLLLWFPFNFNHILLTTILWSNQMITKLFYKKKYKRLITSIRKCTVAQCYDYLMHNALAYIFG